MRTIKEFKFKAYKQVSKKRMKKVWKSITDSPFPSVDAYVLEDEEYERVMSTLRKSIVAVQDQFEYGEMKDPLESEAVVLRIISPEFLILIKKDSAFTLRENLKHELEHIDKGEVRIVFS